MTNFVEITNRKDKKYRNLCKVFAFEWGTLQIPVYTKLKQGAIIEVILDYMKGDSGSNIPHATVRWLEYLNIRDATKALSRWFEKHMDVAISTMIVSDGDWNEYEPEMAIKSYLNTLLTFLVYLNLHGSVL